MNDKTEASALSSDATEVRAQKLKLLREQIGDVYPAHFHRTITNAELAEKYKDLESDVETIEAELRAIADRMGKKLKVVVAPLFVAVSGSSRSLPLFDSMAILGRSVVRQRLKLAAQAVASLVGPKN